MKVRDFQELESPVCIVNTVTMECIGILVPMSYYKEVVDRENQNR